MDVARDRQIAPTLFDAVAARPNADTPEGPSFRDCFTTALASPAVSAPNASVDGGPSRDYSRPEPSRSDYASSRTPTNGAATSSNDETHNRQRSANASPTSAARESNASRPKSDGDRSHRAKPADNASQQPSAASAAPAVDTGDAPDEDASKSVDDPAEGDDKTDGNKKHDAAIVTVAAPQTKLAADGTPLTIKPDVNHQEKTADEQAIASPTADGSSATGVPDPLAATLTPPVAAEPTPVAVDPTAVAVTAISTASASDAVAQVVAEPSTTAADSEPTNVPTSLISGDQIASQGAPTVASDGKTKSIDAKAKSVANEAATKSGRNVEAATTTTTAIVEVANAEDSSSDDEQHFSHSQGERSLSDVEVPKAVAVPPVDTANSNAVAAPDGNVAVSADDAAAATVSAAVDSSSNAPLHTSTDGVVNGAAQAGGSSNRLSPAILRKVGSGQTSEVRGSDIDPARFLHRVVKAFESAQQRDSEIRLRLHPAELGSLSIEVKVQDGGLTARVQAETSEARTALLDNLPALRDRLAEQGIRIDKFDVDLMDHSDHQPRQSLTDQHSDTPGRQGSSRNNSGKANNADVNIGAAPSVVGSANTGLNVLI